MINTARLDAELQTVGLSIESVSVGWTGLQDEPLGSYHLKDGHVTRLIWKSPPTPVQKQQAGVIVAAHNGMPTVLEKLDAIPFPTRLAMAHNEILWSLLQTPPAVPPPWAVNLLNESHTKVVQAGG